MDTGSHAADKLGHAGRPLRQPYCLQKQLPEQRPPPQSQRNGSTTVPPEARHHRYPIANRKRPRAVPQSMLPRGRPPQRTSSPRPPLLASGRPQRTTPQPLRRLTRSWRGRRRVPRRHLWPARARRATRAPSLPRFSVPNFSPPPPERHWCSAPAALLAGRGLLRCDQPAQPQRSSGFHRAVDASSQGTHTKQTLGRPQTGGAARARRRLVSRRRR